MRRQNGSKLVEVVRQVFPDAGCARHTRLSAQLALHAHLAGNRGDLIGKDGQDVDHLIDGACQYCDFTFGLQHQLSFQIAVGHRGNHSRYAADLCGQVGGHGVHIVGQILPDTGCTRDARLSAQLAFGAHLVGHPCDLRGERAEKVHHGIDRVLQLQELALGVHGNLGGEFAIRDRGGHGAEVAHLTRQVAGHRVHADGQVPPNAADAFDFSLTAQFAFRAHFVRHAGDLRGERTEQVHHGVDCVLQLQNLALSVHGDLGGEVAIRDRGGHRTEAAHLPGQLAGHGVHAVAGFFPGACRATYADLFTQLSLGADLARHASDLGGEQVELAHGGVDDPDHAGKLALQGYSICVERKFLAEIALGDACHHTRHLFRRPH